MHVSGLECDSENQNAHQGTQYGKRVIFVAFLVGVLVGTLSFAAVSSLTPAVLFSRKFSFASIRADKNLPIARQHHLHMRTRHYTDITPIVKTRPTQGDIVAIKNTSATREFCPNLIGMSSAILVDSRDYQPYQVEAAPCWFHEDDVEFTGRRKDLMEGIHARELTKLANSDELKAKIEEASREGKALVIGFFASWCRACMATKPKFMKITKSWPQVEFCEILYDDNKDLAIEKGIKSLPFFELYTGDKERVDAFQCGPKKINMLHDTLKNRLDGFDV
mmetsp:Transcript_27551/g.44241  ORF Transcript_27551/g.44241 Transcript_27551/m.44241 type:complete len:278 (+) Transcript_27551:83-916(+)